MIFDNFTILADSPALFPGRILVREGVSGDVTSGRTFKINFLNLNNDNSIYNKR